MLKRSLAALLSLCCILPFFAAAASAEDAGTPLTTAQLWALCNSGFGDIDGGGVSFTDARLALRIAANLEGTPTAEQIAAGDVDGDGTIGVSDARLILRYVAGLSDLGEEIALQYLRTALNNVKTNKPGFTGTVTTVCPSILVTIPAASIETQELSELADYLDETIAEYEQYKQQMLDWGFLSESQAAQIDASIAQWKAQRENVDKAYEPTVTSVSVKTGMSHNYYFPVKSQSWSSTAYSTDTDSVKITEADGVYTITAKYGTYVYTALPDNMTTMSYGRMFSLPSKSSLTSNRTLNSVTFKDGTVVCTVDAATGTVLTASYAYTYLWDFTLTSTDTSGKTVDAEYLYTVNNTAEYTITPATPAE